MKISLREALVQSIIDGWQSNIEMTNVIRRAYLLADIDCREDDQIWARAAEILGQTHSSFNVPAKIWVPRFNGALNDALWDGRTRDYCVMVGRKALGIKTSKDRRLIVNVRERDKRHDWKTTK